MEKIKKLLGSEAVLYLLVGGSNTVLGWVLSWALPRLFHTGYWLTSAICMVIGGTYSYLLNKKFTFRAGEMSHKKTLPRFVLNMAVCYFIAYGCAKPLLDALLDSLRLGLSDDLTTTVKLLAANIVYIVVNYIGQKFFAFRKKKAEDSPAQPGESGAPNGDARTAENGSMIEEDKPRTESASGVGSQAEQDGAPLAQTQALPETDAANRNHPNGGGACGRR